MQDIDIRYVQYRPNQGHDEVEGTIEDDQVPEVSVLCKVRPEDERPEAEREDSSRRGVHNALLLPDLQNHEGSQNPANPSHEEWKRVLLQDARVFPDASCYCTGYQRRNNTRGR